MQKFNVKMDDYKRKDNQKEKNSENYQISQHEKAKVIPFKTREEIKEEKAMEKILQKFIKHAESLDW